MKFIKNPLIILLFFSVCSVGEINAQRLNMRNRVETQSSGDDLNSIEISSKKRRKKKKKIKASAEEIKEAAESKVNARFRKKRSNASKKCKKKTVSKSCKKKNALLDKKK